VAATSDEAAATPLAARLPENRKTPQTAADRRKTPSDAAQTR